jgi:hypothetical protein
MMRKLLTVVVAYSSLTVRAEASELVRLPHFATSSMKTAKGEAAKDASLAGWLVLNGASFRNAEFPELAQILQQGDKRAGGSAASETTPLPFEPFELRPTGGIARGFAICPSKALCGDLLGSIAPFNLKTSP